MIWRCPLDTVHRVYIAKMQQDKDAGVLYTATEDAFLTYPFENPFPEPLLSKSDDAFIRPTHTSAPSALHKSTSCTLNTNLFWGDPHASLYPPVATLSISTSTPRPLTKLSKMLLFHPSIKAPAYAKRLEGVRNITIMYNPRSGNKRGEKVMQQAVSKFKAHGLQVNTVELLYPFYLIFSVSVAFILSFLLCATSPLLSLIVKDTPAMPQRSVWQEQTLKTLM